MKSISDSGKWWTHDQVLLSPVPRIDSTCPERTSVKLLKIVEVHVVDSKLLAVNFRIA